MSEIRKIWLITQGEYSDYGVLFVCEDVATAQNWVNEMNADPIDRYQDEYKVEECDFIPAQTKPFKTLLYRLFTTLYFDGRIDPPSPKIQVIEAWGASRVSDCLPKKTLTHYWLGGTGNNRHGILKIEGYSSEAVLKIYSEKIAMWKAGAFGKQTFPKPEEQDA